MENTQRQPFIVHLRELRARLFWCLLAVLLGTAIGYALRGPLLALLVRPLNQPLYFSSPAGGLELLLQICFAFGVVVAAPVMLYHILRFVQPAWPKQSTRSLVAVLVVSILLLGIGIGFAYLVSLPAALHFLGLFDVGEVEALITTSEYLAFASIYIFGFGLLFQLPLVLLVVNHITPLSAKQLWAKQRFVILASFIVAAILTPSFDIVNQTLFAGPIILLYQVSVLVIWLRNRKGVAKERVGVRRSL